MSTIASIQASMVIILLVYALLLRFSKKSLERWAMRFPPTTSMLKILSRLSRGLTIGAVVIFIAAFILLLSAVFAPSALDVWNKISYSHIIAFLGLFFVITASTISRIRNILRDRIVRSARFPG